MEITDSFRVSTPIDATWFCTSACRWKSYVGKMAGPACAERAANRSVAPATDRSTNTTSLE